MFTQNLCFCGEVRKNISILDEKKMLYLALCAQKKLLGTQVKAKIQSAD